MGPAMATGTRSEATAARAAAEPERKSAPSSSSRTLAASVLRMQKTAGNAAVARTMARPASRAIQRCGANCSCSSCAGGHGHEDELLEEQLGAGLLRSAVARRSG
jgi:hypothetical protein